MELGGTTQAFNPPLRWDGHTHTHLCPHGDGAALDQYLQQALHLGLERYSVTEHPPLPANWLADSTMQAQLCLQREQMRAYFDAVADCRDRYAEQIEVFCGLELDYLHGSESFTLELLDEFGTRVEEAIVSVHFLPGRQGNRCIDYSPADLMDGLVAYYGTVDAVVNVYYDHVEQAIRFASELPIPTRIGHINLIEKFHRAIPAMDRELLRDRQTRLLPLLASTGVGVDVNMAGLRRDTCAKPYVEPWFVEACRTRGILCVFGSDAHSPRDAGAGLDVFLDWHK